MPILLGVFIGLALGLTGGGGSLFAVPLLIYGLGMAPHDAVVVSLASVALVAVVGVAQSLRTRLTDWRSGLVFATGGILGAPLGAKWAGGVPESMLVSGFAALMLVVAALMWHKALRMPGDAAVVRAALEPPEAAGQGAVCRYTPDGVLRFSAPCALVLTVAGLVTGVLAGLFGVGGGFVIVPMLMFVTRIGIHRAVATSLLVICLVGLSGLASYALAGRELPWAVAGLFALGGMIGMFLGRFCAHRLAGPLLQKIFATAIAGTAVFMLIRGFA